jgi:hypothetical protein
VKKPLQEESESSSDSSYDSSDEDEENQSPEVGREIKSEPQSEGKSFSTEPLRSTLRLEPRTEKTMTTEQRNIPVRKDFVRKMTDTELRDSTYGISAKEDSQAHVDETHSNDVRRLSRERKSLERFQACSKEYWT